MLYARAIGKIGFREASLIQKYCARNYGKVVWLKSYFKNNSNSTAVAFLYDSIFLTLLAKARKTRVVISERGDPQQSMSSKTTMAFLHREFCKADRVVFQSPDVKKWYETHMNVTGTVIYNPIKDNLPKRYEDIREKKIVNFCRISQEKNLELLLEAFYLLQRDYPDYELYIYGDAIGNSAEGYLEQIQYYIQEKEMDEKVHLCGAYADVHERIKDATMFVSSSDHEGMSNSMLEAMAMGLPVVCTDCPAGGARAVIRDHENGVLVPVGDAQAMYQAMKEVIEDSVFAEKISQKAYEIRNQQSVETIVARWEEIING
jgi:glycosyltransferase involved in cell wall biosynthesis